MKNNSRQKRKIIIIIAALLAGIITGTAAFGYLYFTQDGDNLGFDLPGGGKTEKIDKRVSVLLIGADKRPGETAYNADTLIVASVDPDTNIISLLSIPRDTRVTLGSDKFLKINSVVMHRGVPELLNQVEDLTGIQLDGYVVTNFDGFKGIIDTLGGIDIYVEKDMKYETGDKVDGVINLKAGQQRLDGSQALQYARYRNDAMADIGRTARQQNVLKAVAREGLQASTITKLPQLIPQVMEIVETDLKLSDMLKLARAAASFDSSNIVSQTLPGVGLYLDGISFWEVNREQAREIAENLLLGITTDKVIDNMAMDLLDPDIREHITVPGSSNDPNGTESPGHEMPAKDPNQKPVGEGTDPNQVPDKDGEGTDPNQVPDKDEEGTDPNQVPDKDEEGTDPNQLPGKDEGGKDPNQVPDKDETDPQNSGKSPSSVPASDDKQTSVETGKKPSITITIY